MSKRISSGQTNTLFNYFQSPKRKPEEKIGNENGVSNNKCEKKQPDNDSDEELITFSKKKRHRVVITDDSDSDHENLKDDNICIENRSAKKPKLLPSDKDDNCETVQKNLNMQSFSFSRDSEASVIKQKIEDKVDNALVDVQKIGTSIGGVDTNWLHNRLEFLKPEKIRDINKNRPSHPDYDERTLHVPEDFLSKQTPAMRQWWILKSKHFDTVLFFKVGKFYELYHMDAVVGVNHLGFSYMKGEFAHSGFPESAYGKMASSLIEQGFKIARVEQTETPEMMAERCRMKKGGKYDKVVNREICQISTKGTCVYGAQLTEAKQALPCYMFALTEKRVPLNNRFGVCFVDTSLGTFFLSEFDDDKHCSRLLALFAENPPGLILLERSGISAATLDILKKQYGSVKREMLNSGSQFYSASTTLEKLAGGCYFINKKGDLEWPDAFQHLQNASTVNPEYELAVRALGACMWYLKDCELDIQVFSMKKFEIYQPIDTVTTSKQMTRDHMVLDAVTMENLKLLGGQGTLQNVLDRCVTAFGKRLLQQWICRPLCNIDKLVERQKAVLELRDNPELLRETRDILKKLPDLERQVAKIHTFGNKLCAEKHPDSRAIFYEANTYSKRKVLDLLNTLRGFEKAQQLLELFKGCKCRLLKKLTHHKPAGMFSDLSQIITFFKEAFDQEKAEKDGKIIPQAGIEQDYDEAVEAIVEIHRKLDEYLEEQKRYFGCKVVYVGTDKKRFQLEIPENKTHKVTSEYKLEGTKKGAKKYSTEVTKELLNEMLKAEQDREKIVHDSNRRVFEKFSAKYEEWETAIHCLKILDVLCSLAEYARTYAEDICMPEVDSFSEIPKIVITDGRHPCISNIDSFVPNNTIIGDKRHPSILLLTGPNMGGKSTLMRQIALITVMAQIGSCVPATECKLNMVDRIFTRLGARDDILQGQSTFLVELSEASTILQHATCHSLVLLDELGRGTSTHDGNAIATAYVKKLTEMRCRTIFSTHYHSLVDYYSGNEHIQLGHMACMVENEDEDVGEEAVTFLYKLTKGRCPKSYGFNAARLAGLPKNIIGRAREVADQLEAVAKNRQAVCSLASVTGDERLKIIESLRCLKV